MKVVSKSANHLVRREIDGTPMLIGVLSGSRLAAKVYYYV